MRFFGDIPQPLIEVFKDSRIDICEKLDVYADFSKHFGVDESRFNVLILKEPQSVLPHQYSKKLLDKFNIVLPFGKTRAQRLGLQEYLLNPYDPPEMRTSPFSDRGIRIAMINSNRISASKQSNYSLRREVAHKLSEKPFGFKMFGTDWDRGYKWRIAKGLIAFRDVLMARQIPDLQETFSGILKTPRRLEGFIDDKFEILRNAEISVVIENESDYVSEKVFDSLIAGAIPVYVGPKFPPELIFLEELIFRGEHNAESVLDVIQNLTQEKLNTKRLNLDKLSLNCNEWSGFSSQAVWIRALEIIEKERNGIIK